jgi:uncharacterized protein involved in exopolysaccharide biosynthesis
MSVRYAQTFSRHRILLSTPLALALLVAIWFIVGTPAAYEAKTTLWVDNPVTQDTSVNQSNPAILPPAAQAQSFLDELLTTRQFRVDVGHRGPLAKFLSGYDGGWSPTDLLRRLRGSGSLDGRIMSALGSSNVSATVEGPQVLAVSLKAPSPTVAAGTLSALVDEFTRQRSQFDQSRLEARVAFYTGRVKAASDSLETSRAAVADYEKNSPQATASDPTLQHLTKVVSDATVNLAAETKLENQAAAALGAPSSGDSFRVIDAPAAPSGGTSGVKRIILVLLAGLFVGVLVSALGLFALTSRSEAGPEEDSRPEVLDGPVVGNETPAAVEDGAPLAVSAVAVESVTDEPLGGDLAAASASEEVVATV